MTASSQGKQSPAIPGRFKELFGENVEKIFDFVSMANRLALAPINDNKVVYVA